MILFGKLVRSLKTKHLKRRKKENFVTPIELERNEKYEKKRKKTQENLPELKLLSIPTVGRKVK